MKSTRVVWLLLGGVLAVFALVLMFSIGGGTAQAMPLLPPPQTQMDLVINGTFGSFNPV
ncbi:MAG: hypothetical protein IH809_02650, partial [Proteobacteria bacterium]|nr:hypothetical protein [Pseudomonadota bacterium]